MRLTRLQVICGRGYRQCQMRIRESTLKLKFRLMSITLILSPFYYGSTIPPYLFFKRSLIKKFAYQRRTLTCESFQTYVEIFVV